MGAVGSRAQQFQIFNLTKHWVHYRKAFLYMDPVALVVLALAVFSLSARALAHAPQEARSRSLVNRSL